MNALAKTGKYVRRLALIVSIISFLGVIAMMLLIAVDVFLRKLFNNPIEGSYEIVQYMLMMVVFASFAYTQSNKGHIHVSMFVAKFPWYIRSLCYCLTELLSAGGIFALSYAAMLQAQLAQAEHLATDVLKFSTAPFFWVESGTMLVFCIVLLFDAVCNGIAIFSRKLAEERSHDYV